MNVCANGDVQNSPAYEQYTARNEHHIKNPADFFIFIDTDMGSNPGNAFRWNTHIPAYLNSNRYSIGYADGHAEAKGWNPDHPVQTAMRGFLRSKGKMSPKGRRVNTGGL
jgi:hypothetical protein